MSPLLSFRRRSNRSVECQLVQPFPRNEGAEQEEQEGRRRDRVVAVTLAVAIVILLVAFIVLFVQIDPLLSDFTSSGAVTPDIGSPAAGTPAASPAP